MNRSLVGLLAALSFVACEDASNAPRSAAGGTGGSIPTPSASAEPDYPTTLTKEERETVLAKVGPMELTLGEFERRLNAQAPYARARYNSLERKKEFLDNIVRFEVLAAEAARRGYDRDPEVIQQMKQTMVRKLMTREVQTMVKLADVTDVEMKKYYDEHAEDYHKPEQVRISHILVADEAAAKKLHKELTSKVEADRRNYRKIFSELARKHSADEETKARGGDLRFFAKTEEGGEQTKALSDAAFTLAKVGDISAPVKTDKGWHVLLLTGRKNRYDRTFEQVKRQIQNRLYRTKKRETTDKFVEDLKTAAKVVRHDAELDKIKAPAGAPKAPPGGPGAVAADPGSVLGPVDRGTPPKPGAFKLRPPPLPKPLRKDN